MIEVGRAELAPGYSISRVINGCWQLSPDHGGGPGSEREAMAIFAELFEHGYTTFDCADIYTGVEALLGRFRAGLPDPDAMQIHTKLVPDQASLSQLTAEVIDAIIHRSLRRLGVERLDLVQCHWWDYAVPGLDLLAERLLRAQQDGKLRLVGATNFDTEHVRYLLHCGLPLVSLQAQYSLLDRRPERHLAEYATEKGVALLAYGVLAGGFLNERYLGAAQPAAMNRSLTKYRLIIDEIGGWVAFQGLLAGLVPIAARHGVTPGLVAARWVLDQPMVAAVILGTGSRSRAADNKALFALQLDDDDRSDIQGMLAALPIPEGDMYALERRADGPHAAIIRTNLQEVDA